MIRGLLISIEKSLPAALRRVGTRAYNAIPAALRYGRTYRDARRFLEVSQYWSREQLDAWQLSELQSLIHHAYEHTPFYRRLYDENRIAPRDIRSLNDLRALPLISKDDVRAHSEELKAGNLPGAAFQYHTTGGSTGKPLGLYWEASRTVPLERAFMRRQFRWVGFDLERDRSVALRGIPVANRSRFERLPDHQIRFSSYDLTPSVMDSYLVEMRRFRPAALLAYPSSATVLARHLVDTGAQGSIPGLRVVLCGSENLYDWQRTLIEQAFGCRVYSWYGQSEYVCLAGECERSNEYHVYPEYGVTEILTASGNPAAPGQTGEIVATGFNNRAFPLIRYRTEDLARRSTTLLCECGRHYDLLTSIEGRLQEMIVGRRGNLVSMTAINMHTDVFDRVHQFQFHQEVPGRLDMSIVPVHGYTPDDEAYIRRELGKKLRDDFDLTIRYVDSIPLTPRGKATFLVQKLHIAGFPDATE